MERVPIQRIDANHGLWHVRVRLHPGRLRELEEDLRLNGQRTPLLVRPDPQGSEKLELISGSRRLAAARAIGWDTVAVDTRRVSSVEAAVLAVRDEAQAPERQCLIERAWAVARLQKLRKEAGLPASVRAMEEATRWKRQTLHNALRVGRAIPRELVEEVARELEVPLEKLIPIAQRPLLLIAEHASGDPKSLFYAVAQAYLHGTDPVTALKGKLHQNSEDGGGNTAPKADWSPWRPRDVTCLEDGSLQLSKNPAKAPLTPHEARSLAEVLWEAAETQDPRRPTLVQRVQHLDAIRGWLAKGLEALRRLLERARKGIGG